MRINFSVKDAANIVGIISLGIALIIFLPILNWFFNITPFQKYQGLPLLLKPLISPIGFLCGFTSVIISPNKLGKGGIISNTILFFLPFLYWYLGTLIFGP